MSNTKMIEKIKKFVEMPHSIQFKREADGFVAFIPDLVGCISQGDSLEEAYVMVMDAKAAWIESALKEGESIPEPSEDKKFSGRFLLRIPPALHADLSKMASLQGVSLNYYLTYLLTKENQKVEVHFHDTKNFSIEKIEVNNKSISPQEIKRY